jgi:predicted ATP-binding protein involved in virulence
MKIKELHLTNFRGFEQLDIEFKNRLAVFIGVNGAGKSAVLDAVCLYFIQLVKGITDGLMFGVIDYDIRKDIKRGKKSALLNFDLEYKELEDLGLDFYIEKNIDPSSKYAYNNSLKMFFRIGNLEANNFVPNFDLPIFIHFKSSKVEEEKVKTHHKNITIPQYWAYYNAFFHSIGNFSDFVNWFKDEEDREKDIIIAKQNFTARNIRLEVIRMAVSKFLFLLNGQIQFTDLKTNREINLKPEFKVDGNFNLTIKKNNETFDLDELSEGEKLVLMLVCDIARRLTIANPSLENPLEGEGIVLIDEIDLHLHPQWQREVIPALLATFPNLQFIVTTHSPQVLSKVSKESIFILENGKLVDNVPFTYGRNASAILFEIFGVTDRPTEIQDKINLCSQLLEDEKYDKAKILLKELTDLLGENDEAIVGARTQLLFDNQMAD